MVGSVLKEELRINLTLARILCEEEALRFQSDPDKLYCNVTFDHVTCWPATPAGSWASMPCPLAPYTDHTQNATFYCQPNGTWANRVDYMACVSDKEETLPKVTPVDETPVRVIYLVGFGISTLALILALAIFLYFRSLRCLRNIIHCHLIVSFILKNVMYIILHSMIEHVHRTNYEWVCKMKVAIMNYLHCTNFFWMFVEGMYLFSMVVWAFSAGKIKHWHYIIVGWVCPVLVTAAWVITKAVYDDKLCWLPNPETSFDYIMHTPIIIVLVCNVFFLATIIWVLVTKLRASNSLETRQYRIVCQHIDRPFALHHISWALHRTRIRNGCLKTYAQSLRASEVLKRVKAVRAILVLFPLLGLTYLLVFYGPAQDTELFKVFKYMNAVLQTLQGLLVAIFYCFLNGEVQTLLRKKLSSIQDSRGLFTRHTKSSFVGSPARSSFHALSMTTCNGRPSNAVREKRGLSETTSAFSPEEEEVEKML